MRVSYWSSDVCSADLADLSRACQTESRLSRAGSLPHWSASRPDDSVSCGSEPARDEAFEATAIFRLSATARAACQSRHATAPPLRTPGPGPVGTFSLPTGGYVC